MKVLVCGGRNYSNKEVLYKVLNVISDVYNIEVIISGAAKGADTLAAQWAKDNNIKLQEYPADWNAHGKSAGPIRNKQMIDEGCPDLVVAFPGGSGTANMIKQSKKS